MNKFLSVLCALVLVFSLSSIAYADACPPPEGETITITKDYQATNKNTTSPAETFNFTIEKQAVTDAAEGVTVDNMPVPTIGAVSYASGEAGSAQAQKQLSLTLPEYPSIGIYTYLIHEITGNSAGVAYRSDPILLRITVVQEAAGLTAIAAVHTESSGDKKSDTFINTYAAGSLSITKNVTGNLGDLNKEFVVTVTFYAPQGKSVNEAITYTNGSTTSSILPGWVESTSIDIPLKHGDTLTFQNIPYGVAYNISEKDYTSEGYEAPQYDFSDPNTVIDSELDTVSIINNKNINVDTGIHLDSVPYLILLVMIAGAVFLYGKAKHSLGKH